jgi:hypothetical protein
MIVVKHETRAVEVFECYIDLWWRVVWNLWAIDYFIDYVLK